MFDLNATMTEPCAICGDDLIHQVEIETETYMLANSIGSGTTKGQIIHHLRANYNLPEWLVNITIPEPESVPTTFINLNGPLVCIHLQSITESTRIAGVDRTVYLDNRVLDPSRSQQVYNHSPNGFSWGYGGSGPAQLALALLLEAGASEMEAQKKYQEFKWEVIATMPDQTKFSMPGKQVIDWLTDRRKTNA